MAKCGAGECEVECGNKGCGCIAESDHPENCSCYCFGGESSGGLKLDPSVLVDVSFNGLALSDAAIFLASVHGGNILVPASRLNESVSLNLKRERFGRVLNQMGLTTRESVTRGERRAAFQALLAGFAAGAALFSLAYRMRGG